MNNLSIITKVRKLVLAYQDGALGDTTMPEDCNPDFESREQSLLFFSLSMALNYQRDSFKLWRAARETFDDINSSRVFSLEDVVLEGENGIRPLLLKHKLALQPNKHINTWYRISWTVNENWGSFENLILNFCRSDFLLLKNAVQKDFKKGFPYLSGPKIFNYWSYILTEYCGIDLKNSEFISIAPDTHVIQASVKLGLISRDESNTLSRDEIAKIWKSLLENTDLRQIDVHSPLWFWSRGGFTYEIV